MTSYSAGTIPPRDHRPVCAHRAAHTAEPGRKGGDRMSATSLDLGHGLGIELARPAAQAGIVRRPSPCWPRAGRAR